MCHVGVLQRNKFGRLIKQKGMHKSRALTCRCKSLATAAYFLDSAVRVLLISVIPEHASEAFDGSHWKKLHQLHQLSLIQSI